MEINREKFIENFAKIKHHAIVMRDLQGLRWMVDGLIDLIARVGVCEKTTMVEVGSYYGGSTVLFATTGAIITCVDQWAPGDAMIKNAPTEWPNVEALFDSNTAEYANVRKIKGDSAESAKAFEDKSLDFVYIDADHTYASVTRDVKAWLPKIKTGGWIAGHDFSTIPDVARAVREMFPSYVIFKDSSWAVKL